MKKLLFLIPIFFILLPSAFSAGMAKIENYTHYDGDFSFGVSQCTAMTFTIGTITQNTNYNLSKFTFQMSSKVGSTSLNVCLYSVDPQTGTSNDVPANPLVCNLSNNEIINTPNTFNVSMPKYILNASKKYAIVLNTSHSIGQFTIAGDDEATPQTYGGGNYVYAGSGCLGWSAISQRAIVFEVWSENGSTTDTTLPNLNISINDTSLVQGDGVNISANLSDETALSFTQFIVNQTGVNQYFNYSLSGTGDKASQNFTISIANGGTINFTVLVNDTSNNKNQVSQILTTADTTAPVITNFSLQRQPIMNSTQTNIFRIYCEDASSFLDRINFTLRFNLTTRNSTRFLSLEAGGFGAFGEGGSGVTLDTKNYIWNYTLFQSDETATEGFYNITNVGCRDRSTNYAKNDSSNSLVGFDFLMDTPPTINSRSPANGSSVTSTNTTGNAVITETNPSFMLIYHNITGVFRLNQTINYSGDSTTENVFNLTGMTNGLNYVYALNINTSFGTWTNTSNISFTVAVSSDGGGSSGGGGGGGGASEPTIVLISQELQCSSAGINYTISNIQGSILGYSLVTDYKNTRQKCRDILLKNNGIENVTIILECTDTGNFTLGFCNYVDLSETKVQLEPNIFQTKTVQMCIKPLDESIEGDIFYFSIKTSDEKGICTSQLSNQVETGGFNGFLAKFVSFRRLGRLNYPLILPAIFFGFVVGLIFNLLLGKLVNLPALGILSAFLTSIGVFIGYLLVF